MRGHERASTLLTSNRPIDDRGKLLGDTPGVTAMLDHLLHRGQVLKCVAHERSQRVAQGGRITVDTHRLGAPSFGRF